MRSFTVLAVLWLAAIAARPTASANPPAVLAEVVKVELSLPWRTA